ncbi:hypothetical protein GSS87_09410 [Corynebacterium sp. 4HC-13]|uniref:galactan 5-O-arabinofuranosyltransferase n=1 Tax=Corynebacterium anserum TaxID=2684406 RepID=UPI00163A9422|nr:galactan 5-O-arabinofuranosyltransferase [Corynebacterium anserum]MBC2682600.1 hypothetical protein [Corynebacterium anserum]
MNASPTSTTHAQNAAAKEIKPRAVHKGITRHHGLSTSYLVDTLSLPQFFLRLVIAGASAAVLTVICWLVIKRLPLLPYPMSFLTRTMTTVVIVFVVAALGVALWFWLYTPRSKPLSRWLRLTVQFVAYMAPAMLVVATLAIPLAKTALFLDGISIDQGFRTEYLTRMADHLSYDDMAYADVPSFYPGLWFFTGGLFAKVTGLAGWGAFQPWALITLAVTGSMLVPVWQRLCGSLAIASAVAMATTAIVIHMEPEEPYAAIVAMGMPAAFIMARRALDGGKAAMAGSVVYLGLSANLYTLFTATSALTVVVMAFLVAGGTKSLKPIIRLTVIGFSSLLIAAIGWGPYLLALLTRPHGDTDKAQHFLPVEGTEIPFPFLENPAMFVLGAICIIWMISRFRDPSVHSQIVGLGVCYAWVFISMLAPLAGTTLLGFRLSLPIGVIMGTCGILALAELRLFGFEKFYPDGFIKNHGKTTTAVLAIIAAATCIHFTTSTPVELREEIDRAYQDTDGNGNRADNYPADSGMYFPLVARVIEEHTGKRPSDTVVLTDEMNLLSYYPYRAFQAMTAHYANPLGEFDRRNEVIESWTHIKDPRELLQAMDKSEQENGWKSPDVMIFRGKLDLKPGTEDDELPEVTGPGNNTFSYIMTKDIHPRYPNVEFRAVHFSAQAFSEGWTLKQVGPLVVAMRDR